MRSYKSHLEWSVAAVPVGSSSTLLYSDWQPISTLAPRVAYADSLYRLRFTVVSERDRVYYAYFGKADRMRVQNGTPTPGLIGDMVARSGAQYPDKPRTYRMELRAGEPRTYTIAVTQETARQPRFSLRLYSADTFWREVMLLPLGFQFFFHGAVWIMIGYVLVLLLTQRERTYAWYVAFMVLVSVGFFLHDRLHYLIFTGMAAYPHVAYFVELFVGQASILVYIRFVQRFIQMQRYYPRIYRGLSWYLLVRISTLPILVGLHMYVIDGPILLNALFLIEGLLLLVLSLYFYQYRNGLIRYFLLATFSLAAGVLLSALGWFGMLSLTWTEHAIQFGILGQLALFSAGLGYRQRRNARMLGDLQTQNEKLLANLAHKVEEQEKTLRLFVRYVPEPVVQQALARGEQGVFEGEQRYVTVMFCDIRGFTAISERLAPREVVDFLNDFYATMTAVIRRAGGVVNQYVGDEVFAVFGAPLLTHDNELRAVQAARSMIAELPALNDRYRDRLGEDLRVGIGLNAGEVIVGNMGSEERIEYCVVGDTVNTCKRIEQLTKAHPNSIYISASVYEQVANEVPTEPLPPVQVRGKREELLLWRVPFDRLEDRATEQISSIL